MGFLDWLQNTPLAVWVADSSWAFPIILTLHAFGMGLVVGIILMINIRVLGYPAAMPFVVIGRLIPLVWAGFFINVTSGILLFIPTATEFFENWAFQIKIFLIILGGIALWALLRILRVLDIAATGNIACQRTVTTVSSRAKVAAAASLLLWLGAIVAGRIIAYV